MRAGIQSNVLSHGKDLPKQRKEIGGTRRTRSLPVRKRPAYCSGKKKKDALRMDPRGAEGGGVKKQSYRLCLRGLGTGK